MALQLTIPIAVNQTVFRLTGANIGFNANGSVSGLVISVSAFVDNVALVPIATIQIKSTMTPAQTAGALAFLYTQLKLDALFAGAVTIADPA